MRFTNETKDKISKRYAELRAGCRKPMFEVRVDTTGIICGGCYNIDELSQTIDQLTALKKAIEEVTGIIV